MRGDYHQSEGRIAPSPRSTSIPVGTPNGKRAWAGGRVGILIMCCCASQSATKECRTMRSGRIGAPRAQAAQAADSASLAKQGARGADAWARPLCTTCSLSLQRADNAPYCVLRAAPGRRPRRSEIVLHIDKAWRTEYGTVIGGFLTRARVRSRSWFKSALLACVLPLRSRPRGAEQAQKMH